MKTVRIIIFVTILSLMLLTACTPRESEQPPDEVTVQLAWAHHSLHAGFYAADQNGYYADEGLVVNLLPLPSPGTDIEAVVTGGTADFGVDYGAGLLTSRSKGQPVRAIAVIHRHHPLAFITLASSGINSPQDFPGHTVRTLVPGSSEVAMRAMMTRLDLDPDSVQQVDVGFALAPFLAGELDIWPGLIINEALIARNQGHDVNLILPEDYGVHLYGITVFTTEQLIEENPDLVERFLRATLQGWRWAIENPDDAGPLALEYDTTLDAAHQVAMIEASQPLVHTGEDQIGWMRVEVWAGMHDILVEQGVLDYPLEMETIFTMEFLERIYGGES